MRQVVFFALREDIVRVIELVEKGQALSYTKVGDYDIPRCETYARGLALPRLGVATADSAVNCESFLVAEQGIRVSLRRIDSDDGRHRFCVDQLINPDTVTLASGGLRDAGVVLCGRIATASESPVSQRLMRRFHNAIRKCFARVNAYYVGPGAHQLWLAGARLTISIHSPAEFDLRMPKQHSTDDKCR